MASTDRSTRLVVAAGLSHAGRGLGHILEPFPGGRLFEQCGDGGLLWYTVLAITPNESLSLAGYCTAEWGGPCTTLLTIKLAASGEKTRLTVSDALYGRVSDEQITSLSEGWQQLFGKGLREFVEA